MTRKWAVLIVSLLFAVAGVAVAGMWWKHGGPTDLLRLPGIVETQDVRVASKVGGRVAEVFVSEGERVVGGQKLVRLNIPEVEARAAQWQAKRAAAAAAVEKLKAGARPEEIAAAQAMRAAAAARLEKLRAGSRAEEIRGAEGEAASAEADLKLASQEFERVSRLAGNRAASQNDLDTARANRNRALGMAAAATARYEMMKAGPRPEEIAEAQAELDRAQASLDLLLAGTRAEDIRAAEAELAYIDAKILETNAELAEGTVEAEEAAVVEVLSVRAGDVVAPSAPVARLLRAEDLWVRVYVPELDLGKITLGQTADVIIDAYPDHRFLGKVVQIASISEFTPRNVQSVEQRRHQVFGVKVQVADPRGVFKSGMAAEVVLPIRSLPLGSLSGLPTP